MMSTTRSFSCNSLEVKLDFVFSITNLIDLPFNYQNHTLPTLRAARYTGGVWVGTFLKVCTHQRLTREGMTSLAPLISRLARGEGLMAHANAAEGRLERYRVNSSRFSLA